MLEGESLKAGMFGGNSSCRISSKLGKGTLPEEEISVAGVKRQCRNHSGGSPHTATRELLRA